MTFYELERSFKDVSDTIETVQRDVSDLDRKLSVIERIVILQLRRTCRDLLLNSQQVRDFAEKHRIKIEDIGTLDTEYLLEIAELEFTSQ
jgi:hypothetical protein